jgi:hypothetical protein
MWILTEGDKRLARDIVHLPDSLNSLDSAAYSFSVLRTAGHLVLLAGSQIDGCR